MYLSLFLSLSLYIYMYYYYYYYHQGLLGREAIVLFASRCFMFDCMLDICVYIYIYI